MPSIGNRLFGWMKPKTTTPSAETGNTPKAGEAASTEQQAVNEPSAVARVAPGATTTTRIASASGIENPDADPQ